MLHIYTCTYLTYDKNYTWAKMPCTICGLSYKIYAM